MKDIDGLIRQLEHRVDVGQPDPDIVAALVGLREQRDEIARLKDAERERRRAASFVQRKIDERQA